jgi:eukaryotic-like serine/threonine-protein kinase
VSVGVDHAASAVQHRDDDTDFRIGRYEIRGEIGRGTMGIVYEAYDPSLRRTIALKTFHLSFAVSPSQYESLKLRFLTEARLAARLSHPGIVAVHDVGCDPELGTLYIALEYLQGRTLQALVATGVPIGWREALGITRKVAEALHYAHSRQVVHRDIKPANIILLPSGDPKILDFGIAKMDTSRFKLTTCQVFGTPLFMAPEQAVGAKPDGRADLFSLGSIAYTLLTGRLAFEAANIPATVRRLLEDDPEPPSCFVPDLPHGLDEVIARALAKSPEQRYPTGQSLADDIAVLLDSAAPTTRGSAPTSGVRDDREAAVPSPQPDPSRLDLEAELAALVASTGVTGNMPPASRVRKVSKARPLALLALLAILSVSYVALRTVAVPSPPFGPGPALPAARASAVPAATVPLATPVAPAAPNPAPPQREPPKSPPSRTVGVAGTARLKLAFAHPLTRGTLRLWIDDELVLKEALESQETTNIPGFKRRKGRVDREVSVEPGEHAVRVQVAWDDNDRQQTLSARFAADSPRVLEINLGRLRKNLSADWR